MWGVCIALTLICPHYTVYEVARLRDDFSDQRLTMANLWSQCICNSLDPFAPADSLRREPGIFMG